MDKDGNVHYTLHGRWDSGMALLKGNHDLDKLPAAAKVLKVGSLPSPANGSKGGHERIVRIRVSARVVSS